MLWNSSTWLYEGKGLLELVDVERTRMNQGAENKWRWVMRRSNTRFWQSFCHFHKIQVSCALSERYDSRDGNYLSLSPLRPKPPVYIDLQQVERNNQCFVFTLSYPPSQHENKKFSFRCCFWKACFGAQGGKRPGPLLEDFVPFWVAL